MAKIEGRAQLQATITLALSESEASALDAITAYGADSFLEFFYKNLGESCLKPHEAGLRSLFASMHEVRRILLKATEARQAFAAGDRGEGERT